MEERIIELQRWKRELVEKVVRASDGQDADGDASRAGGKGGTGAVDPDPDPDPDSASKSGEGGDGAASDSAFGGRGPRKLYPNPGLGTPVVKLTREDLLVLLRPKRRRRMADGAGPDNDDLGSGGASATASKDARPTLSR